jgi:hypothetical protein
MKKHAFIIRLFESHLSSKDEIDLIHGEDKQTIVEGEQEARHKFYDLIREIEETDVKHIYCETCNDSDTLRTFEVTEELFNQVKDLFSS